MDTQDDGSHSVFTRVIDAAPEALWQAWTDCERMLHWWAPEGWTPLTCESNLRVDGEFLVGLQGPDGDRAYLTGTYEHVEEPSRLIFSVAPSGIDADPARPSAAGRAGARGQAAGVSVHLEPDGSGTRMTVIVENEGNDGTAFQFPWRMEEALDRLEQALGELWAGPGSRERSASRVEGAGRDEGLVDAREYEVADSGRADEPLDDERLAAGSSDYPPVAGRGIDVALAREGFGGTGLSDRVRNDESLEDEGVLDTGLDAEGLDNAGLPDDGLGQDMLEGEFPTSDELATIDSGDYQVAAEDMIPEGADADQEVRDDYLVDDNLARDVLGDGRLGHEVLENDQVVLTEDEDYIEDEAVEDQYVGDEYIGDAMEDDDPGYVDEEDDADADVERRGVA